MNYALTFKVEFFEYKNFHYIWDAIFSGKEDNWSPVSSLVFLLYLEIVEVLLIHNHVQISNKIFALILLIATLYKFWKAKIIRFNNIIILVNVPSCRISYEILVPLTCYDI